MSNMAIAHFFTFSIFNSVAKSIQKKNWIGVAKSKITKLSLSVTFEVIFVAVLPNQFFKKSHYESVLPNSKLQKMLFSVSFTLPGYQLELLSLRHFYHTDYSWVTESVLPSTKTQKYLFSDSSTIAAAICASRFSSVLPQWLFENNSISVARLKFWKIVKSTWPSLTSRNSPTVTEN